MAEHNALTFFPQIGKGVVKVLGLGRDESGTTRVSETLYPIADLWSPVEPSWKFHRGEHLYAVRGTTPIAPAAQFAAVELTTFDGMPNGICTIERIRVSARCILQFAVGLVANPVNLTAYGRDVRNSNPGASSTRQSRTRCRYGDTPAINFPSWDSLGAGEFSVPGFVLAGVSAGLYLTQVTAASQFDFCIEFREREAFPGELVG